MVNRALDYDVLHSLYLNGMSYGDIAKRQGVSKWSVANKLKRDAARHGHTWPPRPPLPQRSRHDSVPVCGVADYVKALHERDVPYVEVARRAGVNPSCVWDMVRTTPRSPRITRDKASRIMKAVDYFERKLREEAA